jgi:hypothetical protein
MSHIRTVTVRFCYKIKVHEQDSLLIYDLYSRLCFITLIKSKAYGQIFY